MLKGAEWYASTGTESSKGTKVFALGGKDPKVVDATLTINDADLVALCSGKTPAKSLFQHGQLRVDGDVSVAHRLGFLNKLV